MRASWCRLATAPSKRQSQVSLTSLRSTSFPSFRQMASGPDTGANHQAGPVESAIREKLTSELRPSVLNIQNDSSKHSHHAAMRAVGGGSGESHFSLTLVSPQFEGMTTIKRHRTVNSLLKEQFDGGLHALSLNLKTPAEWEKDERTR